MKTIAVTILPHVLVQVTTALLASAGGIFYILTEVSGLVLLLLFLLYQACAYFLIRIVASASQPRLALWLRVLQQLVLSGFVVLLLTILAVVFWIMFEYSIWYLSDNSAAGYTFYLEHVVVSVVPQVVEVLVLGEVLRQLSVWLFQRPFVNQLLSASD